MQLEKEVKSFLEKHVKIIELLIKKVQLSWWNAYLSGEEKDYKEYEDFTLKLRKIYTSKEDFEKVKSFKDKLKDRELKRQIDLLHLSYLGNQMDKSLLEKINSKSAKIQKQFNIFRGKVDGKEVTNNNILNILENEKDNDLRKKAWEASKQAGEVVSKDLIELVKLRNEAAKQVGFNDYHEMSLFLQEQNEEDITNLLDKVESLTRDPYKKLKREIDSALRRKYNTEKVFPWHYSDPFLMSLPKVYNLDIDKYYKNVDVLKIVRKYYESIGFDVSRILEKSDLYEKPKKNPHAYCTVIDREKRDVRILMNLKNNYKWMSTALHEFGHGIYFENINSELPFLLKECSNLTTEGISEMLGDLVLDTAWMEDFLKVKLLNQEKEEIEKILADGGLVFARWALVMFYFEKSLYKNPNQDLNSLWWDIKEKYQLAERPENRNKPDYAAKIHFVSNPVYYHNYLVGSLFGCQVRNYIEEKILNGNRKFQNNKKIGEYLKKEVFGPGLTYNWSNLIEHATEEKLNPEYLIKEIT